MADGLNEEIVPREPASAVFSRADFMKESFSVDSFVGNCKGSVPLDVLKANLDDYLKSLKHALIELINEDYADFVNLSTNLVGMWTSRKEQNSSYAQFSRYHVTVRFSTVALKGHPS